MHTCTEGMLTLWVETPGNRTALSQPGSHPQEKERWFLQRFWSLCLNVRAFRCLNKVFNIKAFPGSQSLILGMSGIPSLWYYTEFDKFHLQLLCCWHCHLWELEPILHLNTPSQWYVLLQQTPLPGKRAAKCWLQP